MRHRLLIAAPVMVFFMLVGLRPQSLPFIPQALFSDAVISHWPAAHHLRESVLEHRTFPVWQETILAGQPFAANSLNKTAYPLQWLVLLLPPTLHLNLMIVVHLGLAAWGMWRFGCSLGFGPPVALFCTTAYVLAPKTLAHLGAGHLDILYALAWWPWLMTAVQRLIIGERSPKQMMPVAIFAALLLLSDVRLSLFAFILAAAYALWLAGRRWRYLLRDLPATGIFFILTLAVTVPLLLWRPYLSRGDLTLLGASRFALEGGHLVGLVLPPHGGNPETIAYVSLPVLLLAGIAIVTQPRKLWFWWVALFIAALYALGNNGPLWPLLVNVLPFLLWFRVPSRTWFVVMLAACVLAGYGLQSVLATVEKLRETGEVRQLVVKRLALAGGIGASLFCGGFTLGMLDLPDTIGLGVMVIGLLLGGTLLLAFYGRLNLIQLALLLTLVLVVDLLWTGRNWLEWRAPETWLTHQTELVAALEAEQPARIYSPNFALHQQVAAANDLKLFYGVDPFQLTGIVEAIEQGSGISVDDYTVTLPPLIVADDDDRLEMEILQTANQGSIPDTAVLATWGVSHVIATYSLEHEQLEQRQQVGNVYIYTNLDYDGAALDWPVAWPNLPDRATIDRNNQLTVMATLISGIGLLVSLLLWRALHL